MKLYILITLSVLFFSCSEKILTGVYHRQYETLILKEDSTYDYKYRIEQPKAVSNGTWSRIGKNKLRLKSEFDLNSIPISVVESKNEETRIKILIEPKDSSEFAFVKDNLQCSYIINGKKMEKQEIGIFTTRLLGVKSIKIIFHYKNTNYQPFEPILRNEFQTETYFVKNQNSNFFKIIVPLNYLMFYSITIDDLVKIGGNKLIWPRKGNPAFKKIK